MIKKSKETNMRTPNSAQLPPNYQFDRKIDLKKDKKVYIAIQGLFLIVVAIMIGLSMWLNFPTKSSWSTGVTVLVTVAMCVVYMITHELIHGVFLKLLSGVNPKYFVRIPQSSLFFYQVSTPLISARAVTGGIDVVLLPQEFVSGTT